MTVFDSRTTGLPVTRAGSRTLSTNQSLGGTGCLNLCERSELEAQSVGDTPQQGVSLGERSSSSNRRLLKLFQDLRCGNLEKAAPSKSLRSPRFKNPGHPAEPRSRGGRYLELHGSRPHGFRIRRPGRHRQYHSQSENQSSGNSI